VSDEINLIQALVWHVRSFTTNRKYSQKITEGWDMHGHVKHALGSHEEWITPFE